jgi:hypothetical protein
MAEPIVIPLGSSDLTNQTSTLLTDTDSSNVNSLVIESSFNITTDILQAYLYDSSQNFIDRITTGYDVNSIPEGETTNTLSLDPGRDLISNGYSQGDYQVSYNFVSPLLKNNPNLFISEISLDRTELKINSNNLSSIQLQAAYETVLEDLTNTRTFEGFYLDFGSNQLEYGVNVAYNDSLLLIKLYQPLDTSFNVGANFNVLSKKADSTDYQVRFPIEEIQVDNKKYLRGPNLSLKTNTQTNNTTEFRSINTLTSASTAELTNQLSSVLAENRAELNIDYTDYNNFAFFSSANTRLTNFNYKVTQIETYNTQINTLNGLTNTPATELSSSKAFYENEIKSITKNFDGYDYYLYYGSGSKAWPKQNLTQPYVLFSHSSSEATNWLTQQAVTASEYDIENRNNLYEIFPSYIVNDTDNAQFKLFTELTAQMFDEIWVYTKALENRQDGDNSLEGGISIDLVADALKSYGLDIYESSFSDSDLFTSLLGMTEIGGTVPPTGSEMITTYVTASAQTIPSNDAQKLIYKRLYHNLPYLLKKKGTTAGLRVLLNCFGIPDTILRISEFGGKDKNVNTWDSWYSQFNYNYNTSGSGYIQTAWDGSDFVSTWISASPISLPLIPNGVYNMTVDWGDGTAIDTITSWNDAAKTHNYTVSGQYDVTIKGTIKGFSFDNTGYKSSILDVKEWGPLQLCTSASFYGADNLQITATDRPAVLTTTFEDTFREADNINGISDWKTSNVTNLKNTFRDNTGFNSALNWDVSNVTTLEETFKGAINFNQPVPWSTSAVTSVSGAFSGATSFNQPLNLDLSICSNFAFMFEDAVSFDSPVNLITTTGGTFEGMFKGAEAYNQNIEALDLSSAYTLESMFEGAISFDTDIMGTQIAIVQNMSSMFKNASRFGFSGPYYGIGGWDVRSVTTMASMFENATSFNSDISSWLPVSVTTMQAMFKGASTFNVYIGNWSTLQLTNTIEMFKNATSFNHDLSFWNISQLTDATEMFDGSGLSTANYDALLVGWANQAPNIQSNVDFGAQGIQYTIGISQAARDTLTNAPYNWSIADGGGI